MFNVTYLTIKASLHLINTLTLLFVFWMTQPSLSEQSGFRTCIQMRRSCSEYELVVGLIMGAMFNVQYWASSNTSERRSSQTNYPEAEVSQQLINILISNSDRQLIFSRQVDAGMCFVLVPR